jgi:hypothetical protein
MKRKRSRYDVLSQIHSNTKTPGAFGDPGVDIGPKDPHKRKGKNSKPRKKKVIHVPGKWVRVFMNIRGRDTPVYAKVWEELDEVRVV